VIPAIQPLLQARRVFVQRFRAGNSAAVKSETEGFLLDCRRRQGRILQVFGWKRISRANRFHFFRPVSQAGHCPHPCVNHPVNFREESIGQPVSSLAVVPRVVRAHP